MQNSFFHSEFWREVERELRRAPFIQRGGTFISTSAPSVATRLLQDRLRCISRVCNQADGETKKRLILMLGDLDIEPILYGLLDVLKEAVLIVGGSTGVGAAAGAGIGAFFGGVGAVPGAVVGAAVGAKVGLWILVALGLKSLAEYFIDGLPRIFDHYYKGFTLAWKAGKDPVSDPFMHEQSSNINHAASHITEGHVQIVLLLLSAITAYLLRGKNMQALAKEARGGRLGNKFATWMVQNEDKLRNHPKLQPQKSNRTAGVPEETYHPPKKDPPSSPTKPKGMPQKKVPCFKSDGLPHGKIPEFERQLTGQEKGLNNLSAEEYLKGREAFSTARDPKVARQARIKYEEKMTDDLFRVLQTGPMSRDEAKIKATEMAAKKMDTLNALHNPDLIAGGKDVISDFGDKSINKSIGSQWRNRVGDLDEAVKKIPEADRSKVKMNAKLERCK